MASVALPWTKWGEDSSPFVRQIAEPSLVNDLRKLATLILDDPRDIARFLNTLHGGWGMGLNAPPADSRIVCMSSLVSPMLKTVDGKARLLGQHLIQ
jgi:hypothetical protein